MDAALTGRGRGRGEGRCSAGCAASPQILKTPCSLTSSRSVLLLNAIQFNSIQYFFIAILNKVKKGKFS
jgi:hypothetical protein